MVVLASLSGVLAYAAWRTSDTPLALDYAWASHVATAATQTGMRTVALEEAHAIATSFSHLVLDARKPTDFAAGRIPGAMSLPVSDLDNHLPALAGLLTPEQPILVYCSGAECEESLELGRFLIASGYTNIALFAGGMAEWTAAGHPVEQ
jgi:rhodanese-related sulfurtransferase